MRSTFLYPRCRLRRSSLQTAKPISPVITVCISAMRTARAGAGPQAACLKSQYPRCLWQSISQKQPSMRLSPAGYGAVVTTECRGNRRQEIGPINASIPLAPIYSIGKSFGRQARADCFAATTAVRIGRPTASHCPIPTFPFAASPPRKRAMSSSSPPIVA